MAQTVTADTADDLPDDGILCISVMYPQWCHNLVGGDFYWFHDDLYGMVYDGSCCPAGWVTWRHSASGAQKVDIAPPEGARMLTGVLLPDDVWERVR